MPQIAPTAHDWFKPKLITLIAEAEAAGYQRDVAVAVVTDLMNGALFAGAALRGGDEDWDRDIGEPDTALHGQPTADPAQGPGYGSVVPNPLDHVRRSHTGRAG